MSGVVVLGVDPGFANIGFLALSLSQRRSVRVLRAEVIETEPAKAKLRRRVMDDELRRLNEITDRVRDLVLAVKPDAIASEQRPQLRQQKATAQVALGFAIVATVARMQGIPFLVYTIGEIKEAVTGNKGAAKEQIVERLRNLDPTFPEWPSGDAIKHCADAGGAALCARCDPVIEAILRERGKP